jgi:hypothetical protein
MRFPLFNNIAMVLLVVVFAWVDQILEFMALFKMTRLPSSEIANSDDVRSVSGLSPFATHTGVSALWDFVVPYA